MVKTKDVFSMLSRKSLSNVEALLAKVVLKIKMKIKTEIRIHIFKTCNSFITLWAKNLLKLKSIRQCIKKLLIKA